jgi:hypothetical protein
MKFSQMLIYSLFICYFLVSIHNIFYGPTGYFAKNELEDYKTNLRSHIEEMEQSYLRYSQEFRALQSSRSQLKLLARPLGLLEENEVEIKIHSSAAESNHNRIPTLLQRFKPRKKDSTTVYALGSLSFLLSLVIFLAIGSFSREQRVRKPHRSDASFMNMNQNMNQNINQKQNLYNPL